MAASTTCIVEIGPELARVLEEIAKVFRPEEELVLRCVECRGRVKAMTGQLRRFEHHPENTEPCSLRHKSN